MLEKELEKGYIITVVSPALCHFAIRIAGVFFRRAAMNFGDQT